jgi:hypothetical protein
MTFLLFSPMLAPEERRIDFFQMKDPKKDAKKTYVRAKLRDEYKKQNELERQLKIGGAAPGLFSCSEDPGC